MWADLDQRGHDQASSYGNQVSDWLNAARVVMQ